MRRCRDRTPVQKCSRHGIGHCTGPCRGLISKSDYDGLVKGVEDFLRGGINETEKKITSAMAAYQNRLEFELAAKLRNQLEFVQKFGKRQNFFQLFQRHTIFVEQIGKIENTHVFREGALVDVLYRVLSEEEKEQWLKQTKDAGEFHQRSPDWTVYDRAMIVRGWITSDRVNRRYRII